MASRTASAPCPASAGPFFTPASWSWPVMRGRCSSMVKRVVRSTRVPIAELSMPMMRSPSQWPGTARSAAFAGRWLIMISGETKVLPGLRVRALRHPQRPTGAQAGRQFTAQRSSTLHIKCLIDRLVTDAHRLILGEVEPKATRNLFRAPCRRPASVLSMHGPAPFPHDLRADEGHPVRPGDHTGKPVLHIISQDRINRQLRRLWPSSGPVGVPLCRGCSILWSAAGAAPHCAQAHDRSCMEGD